MPARLDAGRFTFVYYPQDATLARALLGRSLASDSFPGLPRPRAHVLVAIAPNAAGFRALVGPQAPEWGAAIAFPNSRRIVIQGSHAGSDAGDPVVVLRHELAHLALHEYLGDLPPRWFDEGYASYAARELDRNEVLAANLALAIRGMPSLDELDAAFDGSTSNVQAAYALAYQAVGELASLDPHRGLALLFQYWPRAGSLDAALRQGYGITLAGFQQRWQERTRRRYGALALFSDFTLFGVVMLVLVLPLYLARRRRDRHRMEELRAADAAADRAQRAHILAHLLGETADHATDAIDASGTALPEGGYTTSEVEPVDGNREPPV
ncbi:MAG TPA: hypothetical protein VJU87_04295 [Gemmatimonadaceae bacterium]|nr:hypothetical protein [Gemmatimonadaceae bacterium]